MREYQYLFSIYSINNYSYEYLSYYDTEDIVKEIEEKMKKFQSLSKLNNIFLVYNYNFFLKIKFLL